VTLLLPCFPFLARLQCCCILHVHLLFYMRLAGFSAGGSVATAEQAAAAADWLSVCVRTASDPSCITTTTSCFACMCYLSYFMCAGVCHAMHASTSGMRSAQLQSRTASLGATQPWQ
jgi:hypothetical protein